MYIENMCGNLQVTYRELYIREASSFELASLLINKEKIP